MLAILGSLLGLFGSLLPEIMKWMNNKEDHKHEIAMGQLQMEAQKQAGIIKLEEINATADIEEAKALYESAKVPVTGWKFVDGLMSLYNSSVRPTLTYGFFLLYGYVKYSLIYSLVKAGANWQEVGTLVWNSEDFVVFSTIISFYFGSRFLKYSMERSNGKGKK